MKRRRTFWLWWGGVGLASAAAWYFFHTVVRMPLAFFIAAALVIIWLVPRSWRVLIPLALIGEVLSVTPPLALTGAMLAPLAVYWLRNRVEVDISFSYIILVAASAGVSVAILLGAGTYPHWSQIPWLTAGYGWAAITAFAVVTSILMPSFYSRFRDGRYR